MTFCVKYISCGSHFLGGGTPPQQPALAVSHSVIPQNLPQKIMHPILRVACIGTQSQSYLHRHPIHGKIVNRLAYSEETSRGQIGTSFKIKSLAVIQAH
jgi:hypothetical protein